MHMGSSLGGQNPAKQCMGAWGGDTLVSGTKQGKGSHNQFKVIVDDAFITAEEEVIKRSSFEVNYINILLHPPSVPITAIHEYIPKSIYFAHFISAIQVPERLYYCIPGPSSPS
jgi:hypothetical protein